MGIISLINSLKELSMIINISEAKANLSKLVEMAYNGEEVIIAKNNLPLVDLTVHKPKPKRVLGSLVGKFTVTDEFIEEDKEPCELFYGTADSIE